MALPKGLNFVAGIIVLAGGAIPFLSKLGVIGELPAIPKIVLAGLLVLGGLFLLIDGFGYINGMGPQVIPQRLNRIIGFIAFPAAVLLLLQELTIISFMAGVPEVVVSGLLALSGFILFLDGILGIRQSM